MESKCVACHTTDAFVATVITPHINAGIGCTDCHAEHRGEQFDAIDGALLTQVADVAPVPFPELAGVVARPERAEAAATSLQSLARVKRGSAPWPLQTTT